MSLSGSGSADPNLTIAHPISVSGPACGARPSGSHFAHAELCSTQMQLTLRPSPALLICTLLFSLGCETDAQARRKYDAWFPPGSTRQQLIHQYGQPTWTVTRPNDNPTDDQWLAVVQKNK